MTLFRMTLFIAAALAAPLSAGAASPSEGKPGRCTAKSEYGPMFDEACMISLGKDGFFAFKTIKEMNGVPLAWGMVDPTGTEISCVSGDPYEDRCSQPLVDPVRDSKDKACWNGAYYGLQICAY